MGGIRRLSAETTAMADQAPQTTGNIERCDKLQKSMVVWYCGRGHGSFPPESGPSLRNSGRNSGFRRIPPEQIHFALE